MSLCDTCHRADNYCPVWYAGKETEKCAGYTPDDTATVEEEIRQEDS